MLTAEDNERLCRVEADAPMGRMLRRYWIPAAQSVELASGGVPLKIRLLGEDLVAFRNEEGKVGLIAEGCPHRGASLSLARNEDCGLTCIYHGWRIGVDGRILAAPTMPEGSPFIERVRHVAYLVRESGGLVWAYLGDPHHEPPLPAFSWTGLPSSNVYIVKVQEEANWVQALEGVLDSAHTNFLHIDNVKASRETTSTDLKDQLTIVRASEDGRPKLEVEDTPYGFRYAAIRRPLVDADRLKYVRTTLFVAPFYGLNPQPPGWGQAQIFVPIDDTHTAFYNVRWSVDAIGPIDDVMRQNMAIHFGSSPGIDLDERFVKRAKSENGWLQDREAMRRGESRNGIRGIVVQDHAVQESMGAIVDRTKEHLGPTDLAIIHMRRRMLQSLDHFEEGHSPIGLDPAPDYGTIRADEGLIPIDAPWQAVQAVAESALSMMS